MEKLDLYNKLLTVKPSNWTSKYPYNTWTPDKVIFTKKEIKLRAIKKGGNKQPVQVIIIEEFDHPLQENHQESILD